MHVCACLISDGKISYSDWEPPEKFMTMFQDRRDNQITSLEMLAISFGVSTFEDRIAGRNVVIYSDNAGAEGATRKGLAACTFVTSGLHGRCKYVYDFSGAAKAADHNALIHSIWMKLAELRCKAWVRRVPTKENISDDPSRYASSAHA